MYRPARTLLPLCLLFLNLLLLISPCGADTIPNASFETAKENKPTGWQTHAWAGRAMFRLVDRGRTGNRSVEISSTDGADAAWIVQVPVKPFSKYRISAWIKTENIEPVRGGKGALLNLHSRMESTSVVTGTKDWTQVSMLVDTGRDDMLQVNCIIGFHGQAKGVAWFDDLSMELLETRELKPEVVLTQDSAGLPISKYIYSQFIEHMGRCIYGGIWAEILEDRKFYHPFGSNESPWGGVGDITIRMNTKSPFVGEHTPEITGSGGSQFGIRQGNLHLQKDKVYVGRVWLAGDPAVGQVTVALKSQYGHTTKFVIPRITPEFKKYPFHLTFMSEDKKASLEITASNKGTFRVGTVSLMPTDNIRGMRRDTLKLLKDLDAPLYRWPGGNFVSGYDWRDGLGDPDRRPPRKNPSWLGVEHNDFGIHEFLDFCKEIKTEPLVVVNTGFGDSFSAFQEVEYINGAATTPMGKWRAQNGQREPWKVVWWGVGNEMWGAWQLGYMPLWQYVLKHNEVEKRMKLADPNILTVASGDSGTFADLEGKRVSWSEGMLQKSANQMTLLSEHFYTQERPSIWAHVRQVPDAIRAKAESHRRYLQANPLAKARNIRIAMDEWNYWYGPYVFGELGTRYFLKDALGIAAGLHEFYRHTDVMYMANYAQTVNVIGAIKTSPVAANMETTGLVLALYRKRFGTLPLKVTGSTDPLDVSAALSEDKQSLSIAIVNPTTQPQTISIKNEWGIFRKGKLYRIADTDPQAYNDPTTPERIVIKESDADFLVGSVVIPPLSVSLYRYDLK